MFLRRSSFDLKFGDLWFVISFFRFLYFVCL
jgi:hypothetical protein